VPELKIAVTALGAVLPGGTGAASLRRAAEGGAPLVPPVAGAAGFPAATIGDGLKALVRRKGLAALSRGALLAAAAIEDLLVVRPDALTAGCEPGDVALLVGTAFGHVESKADFHATALRDGVRLVSPIVFPNTIINSPGGHAAILFGLTGPNSTITSGRRSGLEAILRATTLLRSGRARRAIVVGADEASPSLLRAMSARRSAGAAPASYSAFLGEVGVALLLELLPAGGAPGGGLLVAGRAERNVSRRRDARACLAEAVAAALAEAGVEPAGVGLVLTSRGTDEPLDGAGAAALRPLLERGAVEVDLARIHGETWGASGALAAGTVLAFLGQTGLSDPWRRAGEQAALLASLDSPGATCVVLRPLPAGFRE
jgi:3-oxoacyl-[acyl-carrier-protein] synthase II